MGLTNNITGSRRGLIIAPEFSREAQKVKSVDDFLGSALNTTLWVAKKGTDGAAILPAVIAGRSGGVVQVSPGTADVSYDMAIDGAQIDGALNWRADSGALSIEICLKLTQAPGITLFAGFSGQNTTLTLPLRINGTTLVQNVSNAVGWIYDAAATPAGDWWAAGNKNGVGTTPQDLGFAPVTGVSALFQVLRIEIDNDGTATLFYDGKKVGTPITNAIATNLELTPYVGCFPRLTALTRGIVEIDYISVEQDRVM